jgi:hypothetical protein
VEHDEYTFGYKLDYPELAEMAWLSQSWSIFQQLRIPRSDWEDYRKLTSGSHSCYACSSSDLVVIGVFHEGDVILYISCLHQSPKGNGPYYVFLRPSIPDGQPNLFPWNFDFTVYWSQDPSGQSIIFLEEQKILGLPEITLDLQVESGSWFEEAYDCIRKYQEIKGFNPNTADFARSMGLPILEVVTDENQFEFVDASKPSTTKQSSVSRPDSQGNSESLSIYFHWHSCSLRISYFH